MITANMDYSSLSQLMMEELEFMTHVGLRTQLSSFTLKDDIARYTDSRPGS
jgi:hypothetical protein